MRSLLQAFTRIQGNPTAPTALPTATMSWLDWRPRTAGCRERAVLRLACEKIKQIQALQAMRGEQPLLSLLLFAPARNEADPRLHSSNFCASLSPFSDSAFSDGARDGELLERRDIAPATIATAPGSMSLLWRRSFAFGFLLLSMSCNTASYCS